MIFFSKKLQIIVFLLWGVTLAGCESLRYYSQAAAGQIRILKSRQPINELLSDPHTPQALKTQLKLVLDIREFAKTKLHLPVANHYLTYTDLKRSFAVWSVYAAPEFSLTPKTWYYPIIGRATYRGYFSEWEAQRYADKLDENGFDTYIAGVAAYSTLGWFDDSVFNTIIYRSQAGLAALMFHELAHQLLYAKGDTSFNESFATAVEQEGLRRWMIAAGNQQAFQDYLHRHQQHWQFIDLIKKYRLRLESLYSKELPPGEKKNAKSLLFEKLRREYLEIKSNWQGKAGYDDWFNPPLNNAKLISLSTYNDFVPAFIRLLALYDGDLEQFYAKCKKLAKLPKAERHRRLHNFNEP
jgi:predicted aminopeptidase